MGVNGDSEAGPIARSNWTVLPLRTPTLPPATTTNTTIVDGWVVDPATPYAEPRAELLAAVRAAGDLQGIILTHHHPDHVGAASWLAAETGLPIVAHPRTAELLAGVVAVTRFVGEGDVLPGLGDGATGWHVLHTPGHASGHIVLHDPSTGRMIVGDMVASTGTIVIDPPDGHMATYLTQLRRLLSLSPSVMVPAHGAPVTRPLELLHHYIEHREGRRRLVSAALGDAPAALDAITRNAYPELHPSLLPLARRSALAHLEELVEGGSAVVILADTELMWRRT